MQVIVSPCSGAYFRVMYSAFLRLLTLAALVLLPFGMGAASAGPAHHAPAAANAGPCNEQGGQPIEESRDMAGCTAACSMCIAVPVSADERLEQIAETAVRGLAARWTSLHPEIATPPPRAA